MEDRLESSENSSQIDIGIIGGGISGLAAAFWLTQNTSPEQVKVTLLEKGSQMGGSIDTKEQNGFTVEAGPNGFLDSKPHTLDLFSDAGLDQNLLRSNDAARKRFIMRNNILQKLPEGGGEFFKSGLLSVKGKLRLAMEMFVDQKADDADETVANFARRRLGAEALDYMIGPMVSGIFAGDPEKMSLKSCFPVIYNLEKDYGGLIKALIKKRKKSSNASGPGGVLTSYKGGLLTAITDLTNKCKTQGGQIELNTEVLTVEKINGQFATQTSKGLFNFDKLIVMSPAYAAADFLEPLDNQLSKQLAKIPYSPIFVGGLGFAAADVKDELDGFGFLIPANEQKQILGALYTSSIFPERANGDVKLLRVLVGGDRNHWIMDKSESELVQIALESTKDVVAHNMSPKEVIQWKIAKAIPQYRLGHSEIVAAVEGACEEIGDIYIGGNILYGVGINDCTRTSRMIVDKIIAEL